MTTVHGGTAGAERLGEVVQHALTLDVHVAFCQTDHYHFENQAHRHTQPDQPLPPREPSTHTPSRTDHYHLRTKHRDTPTQTDYYHFENQAHRRTLKLLTQTNTHHIIWELHCGLCSISCCYGNKLILLYVDLLMEESHLFSWSVV